VLQNQIEALTNKWNGFILEKDQMKLNLIEQ
jgi:hypothetical protein